LDGADHKLSALAVKQKSPSNCPLAPKLGTFVRRMQTAGFADFALCRERARIAIRIQGWPARDAHRTSFAVAGQIGRVPRFWFAREKPNTARFQGFSDSRESSGESRTARRLRLEGEGEDDEFDCDETD
jgi:hypothetical protein